MILRSSFETWDNVFENKDMNSMYNSFLNTYLRIFYSSFPPKKMVTQTNGNAWITMGIRTSCKHKREFNSYAGIVMIPYYKTTINDIVEFCQM